MVEMKIGKLRPKVPTRNSMTSIAHQFRNERLAHRRIEGGGAAEQEGEDVDVPELDGAGDGEEPQDQGETAHGRLGGDEELALVEMVGGEAGPGQQQQLRAELQ